MKLWIGVFAALGAVYGLLFLHPSGQNDPIDTALTLFIAIVYGLAALVMVAGTWRGQWRARAIGLLLTIVADGVLYGTVAVSNLRDERNPEWAFDITRACLMVGGCLLLYGLVGWWRDRLREPPL